jgi:hypothetical protein
MDGGLENMWLIDSGCSRRMIGVAKWFSNHTPVLFVCLILVQNHQSFVGPRSCPCDAFTVSSHVISFRDSHHFSNDCTCYFLVLIFQHVSKGDSNTSLLNQILHLTNPHDKLSTFVLYPSLRFSSIY